MYFKKLNYVTKSRVGEIGLKADSIPPLEVDFLVTKSSKKIPKSHCGPVNLVKHEDTLKQSWKFLLYSI